MAHMEEVSERFERGVTVALSSTPDQAARLWNAVPLADPRLEQARKQVERTRRESLTRR